jgi:hypothetical protein
MVDFLGGAVTMAYFIAAVYFLRFWRRTTDRLFMAFALAFLLLALNQVAVMVVGAADERAGYAYVLRVLGFLLILAAIIDKNTARTRSKPTASTGK